MRGEPASRRCRESFGAEREKAEKQQVKTLLIDKNDTEEAEEHLNFRCEQTSEHRQTRSIEISAFHEVFGIRFRRGKKTFVRNLCKSKCLGGDGGEKGAVRRRKMLLV
jgi:hypothetical protein